MYNTKENCTDGICMYICIAAMEQVKRQTSKERQKETNYEFVTFDFHKSTEKNTQCGQQ